VGEEQIFLTFFRRISTFKLSVFNTGKCYIFVNKFGFNEFNVCVLVYIFLIKLEDLPAFIVHILVYTNL